MGAEQSTGSNTLKSQRDEDIPYTSYSISKPIDGETRASPRLNTKVRRPLSRTEGETGLKHDIVVVAEGSSQHQVDPELQKLESIPVFVPLMRTSLNIPALLEPEVLERLDTKQLVLLCHRYQEHLRQCAEAVAFDQNALCVRIKEIDFTIHTLYNHLTERQRKFAKYAEQIQKVNEISSVLNRVRMNVEQTVPVMERLNSVLPPEDQLEHFSLKSK